MQVVLATGDVIEAFQHPIPADDATELTPLGELVRRVAGLAKREAAVIEERRPKTLVNRSGYHLHDIIKNGELDLARVLVGSEGTLGLITEATIRTDPLPKFRGLALLYFDRLEEPLGLDAPMRRSILTLRDCASTALLRLSDG